MKAANVERESRDHSLAYDESAFLTCVDELRVLASKHDEQL